MARSGNKSTELVQILILTLFITSGFLAISSLVFYFMIPGKRAMAEEQEKDLADLVKQFNSDEFKNARQNIEQLLREAGEAGEGKFRDLLREQMLDIEDNINSFPALKERTIGKTTQYTQPLKLRGVKTAVSLRLPRPCTSEASRCPCRGDQPQPQTGLVARPIRCRRRMECRPHVLPPPERRGAQEALP